MTEEGKAQLDKFLQAKGMYEAEKPPLDLRRGPEGPAMVASGKASPNASSTGVSRDSSPVGAGA